MAKQDRSRKTVHQLLDACERLLRTNPWSEISIQRIVVEAGLSNGAVYGRFKNKDELLVALYHRHNERLKSAYARKFAKPDRTKKQTFVEMMSCEIDQLISHYTKHKWVLREMAFLSREKPDVVTPDMRKDRKKILDALAHRYAPYLEELGHESPVRTMEMIVFFVSTILREVILHPGPHCDSLKIRKKELKDYIMRMMSTFACCPDGVQTHFE